MSRGLWIDELHSLVARFSAYGIGPDMAGLSLVQAWGVLAFLRYLAGAADA